MSFSDIVEKRMKSQMEWSLLKIASMKLWIYWLNIEWVQIYLKKIYIIYILQTKDNQDLYNKVNTSIKTSLTIKLNERFKTSLKQHKSKTIMMPKIKVDKDGNLLDDFKDIILMKKKPMNNLRVFLNQLKK